MIKKEDILAFLFVVLGLWTGSLRAKTIYVDADATPPGDGTGWETAFTYLQDALMVASSGHEIRVAQGIYRPDDFVLSARPNLGREETFQLKNGVTVKGGFAGKGEPDPNARDIHLYETILSGDRSGNDVEVGDPCDLIDDPCRTDNCYHVLRGIDLDPNAVLDGFTVTGGNANGPAWPNDTCGGGMCNSEQSQPTVRNCSFIRNAAALRGGGMYNERSDPAVENCAFAGNAASEGGGMYNDMYEYFDGNVKVIRCTFNANSATGVASAWGDAGAMYNYCGNQTLVNCLFSENTAASYGSALLNIWCTTVMINCTLSGQESDSTA